MHLLFLWGYPLLTQLLDMDRDIALSYLVLQLLDLSLIHLRNLVEPFGIGFLKVLELPLELFELPGYPLILVGQVLVLVLELLLGLPIVFRQLTQPIIQVLLLSLKLFNQTGVLLLLFLQDLQVVIQLLLVQLVKGLHVLQALLKVLDLRL